MAKFNKWFDRNWEKMVTEKILALDDHMEAQTYITWEYIGGQQDTPIEKTRELFQAWWCTSTTDKEISGISLHDVSAVAWEAAEKALGGAV